MPKHSRRLKLKDGRHKLEATLNKMSKHPSREIRKLYRIYKNQDLKINFFDHMSYNDYYSYDYPELALSDVYTNPLSFTNVYNISTNAIGTYNPGTKDIYIDPALDLDEMLETVVHEIQHYVTQQVLEPNNWIDLYNDELNSYFAERMAYNEYFDLSCISRIKQNFEEINKNTLIDQLDMEKKDSGTTRRTFLKKKPHYQNYSFVKSYINNDLEDSDSD